MRCAEFRAMAESYIASELPVDTNHEMIAHLERCDECRVELDARVALRRTVKRAFEQTRALAPDPRFLAVLRATLMAEPPAVRGRGARRNTWLALAAGLILVALAGWQLRIWPGSGGAAASHLDGLAPHAAGDHRDCALEHTLAEAPISLDEAAARYNAAYAGLRQIVDQSEPVRTGNVDVIAAHWCVLDGRSFAHIVVRHTGRVVSLLLTPIDRAAIVPAEADRPEAARADSTPGEVSLCPPAQGFNIACFDVGGHAGFVVSDLSEIENLRLARTLAPVLQAYLGRA